MNQQAFYRDTAIGEFQLDANGRLSYRSWGQRRRTLQVKQHRLNQAQSHLLKNLGLSKQKFGDLQNCRVSGFDWAQPKQQNPWRLEGLEAFCDDTLASRPKA